MEGIIGKQQKPTNAEVLGELINEEKLKFITNVTHENIEGYNGLKFWTESLFSDKPIEQVFEEVTENILIMKCAVQVPKKGNRADQIVDALKHLVDKEDDKEAKSLAQQIKS